MLKPPTSYKGNIIFQAMFDCQGVQAFVIICNVDIWMSAITKICLK